MISSIFRFARGEELQVASLPRPTDSSSQKEERIKAAYVAGHFKPFQRSLERQNERDYGQDSYFDDLKKMVAGTSGFTLDQTRAHALDLFALLVRADLDDAEKQTGVEEYLSLLTDNEKIKFLYYLSGKIPPCIAIFILRYSSTEVFQEACRQSLVARPVRENKGPFNWIKEVVDNEGLYPDGRNFLSQLFLHYPEQEKKEAVYSFFLRSDLQGQRAFLALLHDSLRKEVESYLEEVREFLNLSLHCASLEKNMWIPFRNNQRAYFLHLFFLDALDRPQSFLIAAAFDETDWQSLKAAVQEQRTVDLALRWMGQMVQALVQKEQTDQADTSRESRIGLFFCYASRVLSERFSNQQSIELKKIAHAFSCLLLAKYYTFLKEPLVQQLLPQTIVGLFSLYITKKRTPENGDTVEKTLGDIWFKMCYARGFQSVFDICFDSGNTPMFELAVFSALISGELEVLTTIFRNRAQGISKVASWCTYSLSVEIEKEISLSAKILVFQELQKMLAKVDETLPGEVRATLERSGMQADGLDRLFPLVLGNPEERQQRAYDQLQQLLLNKERGYENIKILIHSLREDLQAGMERSVWIPRLFERLPKQMWPLLFLYLEQDVGDRIDLEKLSQGPSFAPDWLPDTKRWVDLAAQTLVEMVDNPLFFSEENTERRWIPNYLYQVVRQTETLPQVIQRFSLIAPVEKWIPALDALSRASFSINKEKLYTPLVESIEKSQPNKIDFIAERYIAFDRARGDPEENRTYLENDLFDKPFINNDEERVAMLNALIKRLGIQFFGFFLRRGSTIPSLVRAIKSTPDRGKGALLDWLGTLTLAGDSREIKLSIFRRIASNCSIQEFIAFLKEPKFKAISLEIGTWYQMDVEPLAKIVGSSIESWTLLSHFNQKSFYPTFFCKLKQLQGGDIRCHEITTFLKEVFKMPCKQELIDKLLTEGELGEFRKAYKEHVQKEGIGEILSGYVSEMEVILTLKLVDDWAVQLTQWATQKLKKEHDDHFSYGDRRKPSYDNLISVYEALEQAGAGALASWQQTLKASLPKELKGDLLTANQSYYQKKRKGDFEEKT